MFYKNAVVGGCHSRIKQMCRFWCSVGNPCSGNSRSGELYSRDIELHASTPPGHDIAGTSVTAPKHSMKKCFPILVFQSITGWINFPKK